MNLLLDTHAFLWFVSDDPALGQGAKDAIEDPANNVLLSVASVWEMAIKASLGKLTLAEPADVFLPRQMEANGIQLLGVGLSHALAVRELAFHHRDPFDRMLAVQAMREGLTLVSHDAAFDLYGVSRLW